MKEIECKKCGSGIYVKAGMIKQRQRYKCKSCGCQFTNSKRRGIDPALKSFAIVLYAYCGISMSKIARMYKVSVVAVLKWIKAAALKTTDLNPKTESEIVMIDEVWHFVNGKKTKYGCGEPLMAYRVNLLDGSWGLVAMPVSKG